MAGVTKRLCWDHDKTPVLPHVHRISWYRGAGELDRLLASEVQEGFAPHALTVQDGSVYRDQQARIAEADS